MTLTAPNCPVAESLPVDVKERVKMVAGVRDAEVEIVFDPPWNKDMISEAAMLELGLL
jgi:metal-sulfur cluster biosynthetic enzyme